MSVVFYRPLECSSGTQAYPTGTSIPSFLLVEPLDPSQLTW